jgi:DNA-nicking Smr family endonuclease
MTDGRKGRRLSDEDRALWEGVTRSVKPLRKRSRNVAAKAEKAEKAEKETASVKPLRIVSQRRPAPAAPVPAKSSPALAPLERKLKQRLRRGRAEIDARVDLHGHTQSEAHDRLRRFLRISQEKGASVVLVITGKGAISSGSERGVLKRQVPLWLGLPEFRDCVVGYDVASPAHGGEGALYVRLRKKRRE